MARSTDYIASKNIEVMIINEATVGTAVIAGLKKYQVTAFTIPEASVPVEYSAGRAGFFTAGASQGHHAEGNKTWTFDTTLRGTPEAMKLAMDAVCEDNASAFEIANDYAFPQASYKHGSTSSPNTFTVFFNHGGYGDNANHMYLRGCVATGVSISQDIGSEGGEATITINWATGYYPTYTDTAAAATTTYDEGSAKNIRNLAHSETYINDGSDAHEVTLHSWELNITRPMERIGFVDTTSGSFAPHGYAMTGQFEVAGSVMVVKNKEVGDLLPRFYNGGTVQIKIATSDDFSVQMNKCFINEPSTDNGGPVLMESIPFTVVGDDTVGTSAPILSITWA